MSASLAEKIVVAVDGSEPSLKAVRYAAQIASFSEPKITALHVILLPSYATKMVIDALRKDLSAKAGGIMAEVKKIADAAGVETDQKVIETSRSVVFAITDFAQQQGADLIVLGTMGTSGIPKLMLGSVAAGVVSFAHCPVLAVR